MKQVWRVVRTIVRRKKPVVVSGARQAYLTHKEFARKVIVTLVEEYATRHGFAPKRIAIRHTRRRWGSCSAAGNLNFSYKLAFLPSCLARYVVVHELCHLRHLHHRDTFWQEVASLMPDYADRVAVIRTMERTTGVSLVALQAWRQKHDAEECSFCVCDTKQPITNGSNAPTLQPSAILSEL